MKKTLCLLITALAMLTACESDELCDRTVNTPRLIVRFYDPNNLRAPFSVTNLTVYGQGNATPLVKGTSVDSLALPLRLTNPTVYIFQKKTGNTAHTATLTLTYNPEETLVGKSCGIKITYNTLSATIENADTSWLKGVNIKNTTVENEKKAHIHLYH